MKNLLLIFLCVLSISLKAQDKTKYYYVNKVTHSVDSIYVQTLPLVAEGVSTVYNDGKALVGQAGELLKKIAPKIGVAADKVWITLVRQQQVWAYMFTFMAGLYMFSWYVFIQRLKSGTKNQIQESIKGSYSSDSPKIIFSWRPQDIILVVISGVLVIAGTITLGCNWSLIWTGWFNPEYGAMIQLAEFAKSL